MEHFISIVFPTRKVKKSVVEHMAKFSGIPLTESKMNYGIFESENNGLVLKLELPRSLTEHESDIFADKISNKLVELGYNDFDVETSVELDENWDFVFEESLNAIQLGDQKGQVFKGADVDYSLPYIDAEFQNRTGATVRVRVYGKAPRLQKFIQFKSPKIFGSGNGFNAPKTSGGTGDVPPAEKSTSGQEQTPAAQGGAKSIEQIVDTYAKPGMTLADLQKMEAELKAAEPQDLPKDQQSGIAGFFKKLGRGLQQLTSTEDYRVRTGFAAAAWKLRLPGLFDSEGYFHFTENGTGEPKTSSGASLNQLIPLAKAGLLTDEKVAKVVKNWEYKTKDIKPGDVEARNIADKIDAIVSAHEAAKGKAAAGDQKAPQTSAELDADSKDSGTKPEDENPFAGMSPAEARKAVEERIAKLMELLDGLGESSLYAEIMTMLVEGPQEDAQIYKLVKEIEQLLPMMGEDFKPYARMVQAQIDRAQKAVKRHEATLSQEKPKTSAGTGDVPPGEKSTSGSLALDDFVKSDGSVDWDAAAEKLNGGKPIQFGTVGGTGVENPNYKDSGVKPASASMPNLDKFAQSGKGGLANDPDEVEAIKELQEQLIAKGYDLGPKGADGKYGPKTRAAVKKFQEDNGLKPDGDAGPNTIAKLKEKPAGDVETGKTGDAETGKTGDAETDKTKTIYYKGDPITAEVQEYLKKVGRDPGVVGETLTDEDAKALNDGITKDIIPMPDVNWTEKGKTDTEEPTVDENYVGVAPKEQQKKGAPIIFLVKGKKYYCFKNPEDSAWYLFEVENPGEDDVAKYKLPKDDKRAIAIDDMNDEINSSETEPEVSGAGAGRGDGQAELDKRKADDQMGGGEETGKTGDAETGKTGPVDKPGDAETGGEETGKTGDAETGKTGDAETGKTGPVDKPGDAETGGEETGKTYTDMGQAFVDIENLKAGDTVTIGGEKYTVTPSDLGTYFKPENEAGQKLLDDQADKLLKDLEGGL